MDSFTIVPALIGPVEPTVFIVIGVFVVTFIAAAYGLMTRKGSGINEHPGPDTRDPARDPNMAQDPDVDVLDPGPEEERPDSTILDQHGKK